MGERIAQLRQRKGLSQAKLATAVGLSASAIAMYEQGRREPSVNIIIALARALDVTIDFLLTGQPPQFPSLSAGTDLDRAHLIATVLSTAWYIG